MSNDIDKSGPRTLPFANRAASLLPKAPLEYASLFWFHGSTSSEGTLPVTIGWSIGGGRAQWRQGAWQFALRLPAMPQVPFRPMADVEDVYGVLHRIPSESQRVANESLEREIADRSLIFLHRVLLGQRKIPLAGVEEDFDSVDIALLWGPTLPKLIGRLCYSHFSRNKTVAVLEPEYLPAELPRKPTGSWREDPDEPYWEDRAVRRWSRDDGGIGGVTLEASVSAFDLVLPCADGVSGILGSDVGRSGRLLWREKAQTVNDLLAGKRGLLETCDLVPWREPTVALPQGVKLAVRAAFMYAPAKDARESLDGIEGRLTAGGLSLYNECSQKLQAQRIPDDAKMVILQRVAAQLPLRPVQRSGESQQALAARTRADKSAEKLIGQARTAARRELGSDAVPNEG